MGALLRRAGACKESHYARHELLEREPNNGRAVLSADQREPQAIGAT